MTTYVLILLASLVLVIGVTPLAQRVARRVGMVDKPSARKQHTVPTPLLGGAAIFIAVILALILLGDRFYVNQVAGIALGATLVSFLGLWDDRRGLSPWVKLLGQFLAATVLVMTDVRISVLPWEWVNIAATLLWVVFITNAMNLLDNMDGLSAGVAAIAALFFLLFAAISKQYLVGALAAALVGACVGFLFYNLNPASIFMGDTGSLFLGFTLAAVGIKLRFPDKLGVCHLDGAGARAGRADVRHQPGDHLPAPAAPEPADDAGKGSPQPPPGSPHRQPTRGRLDLLPARGASAGVLATFVTQASLIEGYVVGHCRAGGGAVRHLAAGEDLCRTDEADRYQARLMRNATKS